MGKRILITGGSGFLGINLIRYLLAKGYTITNLDFAPFTYDDCRNSINHITGDIRNRIKVDEAIEGVDIVIHCAAALPLYSQKDIFTTDVFGTCNIMQSSWEHKVERCIHISSTAVYGVPDHHPIYEDDKMIGVGAYGEAKIMAEEVSLYYQKKGMCVPILRPKSFIGPERLGVFALLYDWAYNGHNFPILGNGNNRYQLLDVDDLCESIFLCMTLPEDKANDIFNIGTGVFNSIKDDFQSVLDEAGYGKKIIPIPAGPAIQILKFLEKIGVSPLYQWIYDTVATDSFVSIEKAIKILGFKPKYSNKEALLRNYLWYRENINKFIGTEGVSHRVPWKQGLLNLAKLIF